MSNSKITLDDVLVLVEKTHVCSVVAHITLNRVRILVSGNVFIVDERRDAGEDPAVVAARSMLAHHAQDYIARREKVLRDAEEAVVRARSALDEANAIVAKLTAAVEASK
jgi:hypothetical protein